MKKNVIALAVAAAMAAPLAQAEVTVSGTLQSELVSLTSDNPAVAGGLYVTDGMTYGSSKGSGAGQLTFTATEDLGNGMKALAKYNFNIQADDATNGKRDAYVGLTGGFGTVLAGRMSTPYKSSTVKWDPFLATFAQARGNGGMGNTSDTNGSYLDNAVAYANKFGPAKVVIAMGIDEQRDIAPNADSTTGNHAISAAVNVPVGPIELAIAVTDTSDYNATGTATTDRSQTKVGVKYAAGPLTVAAQVENSDVDVDDGSFTYLTASYAMGANTFSASYGTFAADNTAGAAAPAFGGNDATYTAVGMKHAFSKGTSVYVAYRSTTVDVAAGTAPDESAIGAGLRVNF